VKVRFHPRRPSAALIVSIVALVVALGGTAFAGPVAQIAKKISGSSIKAHTITGSRLKNNTLTGTQIRESTLKTVPSALAAEIATVAGTANKANSATTATTAANANALGGVPASAFTSAAALTQRFSATMAKGDADRPLVTLGPVTVTASCSGTATATGTISATSSAANAIVNAHVLAASGTQPVATATGSAAAGDFEALGVMAPDGSAGWNGLVQVAVNTGGDCRFVGHVTNDAG
jgi:hypothetical protein